MSKEEHLCTVIVAVIVFDDQDRLLMTQEVKESCYGKWYIPAGRVKPKKKSKKFLKKKGSSRRTCKRRSN